MCLDFPVSKTRYLEQIEGLTWEIDIFDDANKGLVMAEVELENENQHVALRITSYNVCYTKLLRDVAKEDMIVDAHDPKKFHRPMIFSMP